MVLSSSSPRRVSLLKELGHPFEVFSPDVEELEKPEGDPVELALENARRKSLAGSRKFKQAIAIGADTVVAIDNKILGKPADHAIAVGMLQCLQGRTHRVVTGICLSRRGEVLEEWAELSEVEFKPLTNGEILSYLDAINPYDKAGGYAIQEEGTRIIARHEGDRNNIIGLPLGRLRQELKGHFGSDPWSQGD